MREAPSELAVGVISDKHGLLRPEAAAALRGSDLIVHAGDVGAMDVLDSLNDIAPVLAALNLLCFAISHWKWFARRVIIGLQP